jgi:hypothetical protein
MKVRTVMLCSLLLLSEAVFARESTDVIIMKNGDRLTGQIKGLDNGVLYISMEYIIGTSSMQWSKVHHLESKQLFLVKTQDGTVYEGTLRTGAEPEEQPVKIEVMETPEQTVTIDRSRIVEMDQTSDKFWQRFNGDFNFGMIYSKGNQSTQYDLNAQVSYPRERWAAAVTYSSTLSSSTGASASTRNLVGATAMHLMPWNHWFYEGLSAFLQSSEQEINLQTTLGGGVGRFLKNTNHAKISLLGGVAWQNTQYQPSLIPQGQQKLAAGLIVGDVQLFRFNKTTLDVSATFLPALSQPGRVYFNLNTSYMVKIFSNLTWNISLYGNWDSRPPANFSGSNYGASSGLGWTFGNR